MLKLTSVALLALPVLATGAVAADGGQHGPIRINLSGAQEDPTVITDARGTAVLRIQGSTVAYRVRYRNLDERHRAGAHPHRCQTTRRAVLPLFLCSDLGNDPSGTAACPSEAPGQLAGVIDAADVVGPCGAQGVPAGRRSTDLIEALRAGLAYINIHTVDFAGGRDPRRRHRRTTE